MKRLILSAVALSMLALPVAQAQAGPGRQGNEPQPPRYHQKAPGKHMAPRPPHHHAQKPALKKKRWAHGHRVPAWQRRDVVRDYHRHGLRRPGHGQHWVKVDNDFLLVSVASGIIAGIIAGR